MIKVKRALISVFDKVGLADFAKGLHKLGVEIVSTGQTASWIRSCGVPVVEVADYTGFPEIIEGRVKTLHPKIHAGLLAVRDNPNHMQQIKDHGIGLIDMVVVNFYPFEKVMAKKNVSLEEAIENIDIGGPAMLRSAAKNFKYVAVVCNPTRYGEVLEELGNNGGILSDQVLGYWALEAFERTSGYDEAIRIFLRGRLKGVDAFSDFPRDLSLRFVKVRDLRYGENPHQKAAFYAEGKNGDGLAAMQQKNGKELSFNNILDLQAAVEIVRDRQRPSAVIIKHGNPSGVAEDASLSRAFAKALAGDPLSAFGGVIGLNRPVDGKTAQAILKSGFMECVIAPQFEAESLTLLSAKKNLRLLELNMESLPDDKYDYKKVIGGVLLQEKDQRVLQAQDWKIVTKLKPTKAQISSLVFGWSIAQHVKSNAIVLVKGSQTVGIGAGHMSRVDAAFHAIRKAGEKAQGAVLASDAFLPKPDTVVLAAKAGIKAIIQTGGSIADEDVIQEADKRKIAMVVTGLRHFKH